MKSKLFLEKMSDTNLKELILLLEDLDRRGYTDSEILHSYANTWYENSVGMERLLLLRLDVHYEVTQRWLKTAMK